MEYPGLFEEFPEIQMASMYVIVALLVVVILFVHLLARQISEEMAWVNHLLLWLGLSPQRFYLRMTAYSTLFAAFITGISLLIAIGHYAWLGSSIVSSFHSYPQELVISQMNPYIPFPSVLFVVIGIILWLVITLVFLSILLTNKNKEEVKLKHSVGQKSVSLVGLLLLLLPLMHVMASANASLKMEEVEEWEEWHQSIDGSQNFLSIRSYHEESALTILEEAQESQWSFISLNPLGYVEIEKVDLNEKSSTYGNDHYERTLPFYSVAEEEWGALMEQLQPEGDYDWENVRDNHGMVFIDQINEYGVIREEPPLGEDYRLMSVETEKELDDVFHVGAIAEMYDYFHIPLILIPEENAEFGRVEIQNNESSRLLYIKDEGLEPLAIQLQKKARDYPFVDVYYNNGYEMIYEEVRDVEENRLSFLLLALLPFVVAVSIVQYQLAGPILRNWSMRWRILLGCGIALVALLLALAATEMVVSETVKKDVIVYAFLWLVIVSFVASWVQHKQSQKS